MSHFLNHPEIYNQAILLTEAEKQNPYEVFKRFCSDYSLHEVRDHQWNQMEVCLTTDNSLFSDPVRRADLIYHHEQMGKLLEAVFLSFKPKVQKDEK